MQAIGICRFSYPALGGFQVEHETTAEREAFLYAPERLEQRFRSFETITLPPLRAQTDPDFVMAIVVGDSLPKPYRDRLETLIVDIPQARILSFAPGPHRDIMKQAANMVREDTGEPCLQFRMDDDDAVAVDYIARLRDVAADVRRFAKKHRHIAIDFNQGFITRASANGLEVARTKDPYFTAALAIMFKPGVKLSVLNFSHAKVARNMPTVTMTGEDMLLRGHNDFNDSRQIGRVKKVNFKPLDVDGEAYFKSRFNIDADHVRRVYSGV